MEEMKEKEFYIAPDQLIALVKRIQNNDLHEEDEIYTACEGYVERYFRKKVDNEEDIKDLISDTMATACIKINNLKTPEAFIRWLRCIAYRKCYRYYREQEQMKKRESFDDEKRPKKMLTLSAAISKGSGLGDLEGPLYQAINSLPEKQRAVIKLRMDGCKVREIAEIQQVPIGTVKSRLNYAYIKIRHVLEPYQEKYNIKL